MGLTFSVDGCMSNGDGLFGFVTYNAKKLRDISVNIHAFYIMNYFMLKLIEESYYSNQIQNDIHISLEHLQNLLGDLTENRFKSVLRMLVRIGLIKYQKIPRKDVWKITIL